MIRADKIRAIIDAPTANLRELAFLVGGHPESFYRGTNFNGADLRGQDLRGFALDASTFKGALVDRSTKTDRKYRKLVGLNRTSINLPAGRLIILSMKECGLNSGVITENYLGDIIGEAIFYGMSKTKKAKILEKTGS